MRNSKASCLVPVECSRKVISSSPAKASKSAARLNVRTDPECVKVCQEDRLTADRNAHAAAHEMDVFASLGYRQLCETGRNAGSKQREPRQKLRVRFSSLKPDSEPEPMKAVDGTSRPKVRGETHTQGCDTNDVGDHTSVNHVKHDDHDDDDDNGDDDMNDENHDFHDHYPKANPKINPRMTLETGDIGYNPKVNPNTP